MGILQSVLKYWSSESNEEESPITLVNSYNTSVNKNKLKSSTVFINQNTLQNENRTGKQRVDNVVNAEGIRWIKHYSSCHRILVVGDGDFSFSTCLAAAFGWASNMIATSLDSQDFLVKNYHNALSNLVELSTRKCKVMHEIDATKMCNHPFLGGIKFDRIVFNFPFAGFFKDISRDSQLRMLSNIWNNIRATSTESIAYSRRLRVVEAVDFNHLEYPGYNTKCRFGGDNNFNCYPGKTYKFRL